MKKTSLLVFTIFLCLSLFLFRGYFLNNWVPFPANLLVNSYSPWRDYEWEGYPNGPPTKPIGFDDLRIFYPYRKLITDQLKIGQWPLWNPYNFSGNVHLATYQAPVFYPLNLLYFILPQIDAWSWLVICQPILSGFFMFLFLKKLKLSSGASFFGAFVFAFSGWMIVWLEEDLVKEHAVLWLPLILYAIESIKEKASLKSLFLFILATTASILAGFLQLTLYVLATAFAWIIFSDGFFKRKNLRKLAVLGLGLLFSFLISAPHVWPAVEAYLLSPRRAVDVKFLFDEYLMRPGHLITFLAPDFWGNPGAYNYLEKGFYHEKMIYIGIPAFLLALSVLINRQKDKKIRFFKWFSLITLAPGFFPLGWLLYYSRLPLLSTMIPSRVFFLSTFGFCVLAAFGFENYLKGQINWKKWRNLLAIIGLVFLGLWVFAFYHKTNLLRAAYSGVPLRNLILPTGFFVGSFVFIFLPWLKRKLKLGKRLSLEKIRLFSLFGLFVLAAFSSFYFANKFLYFSERKFVFPEVGVITRLKAVAGINRIWGYGRAYFERNFCTYYGLHCPGGYDALFSKKYGELLWTTETKGQLDSQIPRCDADLKWASDHENILDDWHRQRLLELLGVRYIVQAKIKENKEGISDTKHFPVPFFQLNWEDEKFRIWEYSSALPRFFLISDYLIETNEQKIVDQLFNEDFDLRKTIVLEKEPELEVQPKAAQDQAVELISYTPNRIELTADLSANQLLFLSDNYYPGWRALVNDQEAEILRANYSFRALALPAGEHRIVFSYEPKVFFWSLRVGLASLLLLIAGAVLFKIQKKVK